MPGIGSMTGRQRRRPRAAAPPPTLLAALTLSSATVVEASTPGVTVGALQGRTAGATLTLANTAGGRFALSGSAIATGSTPTEFLGGAAHQITIRETLAGAANSPRDTVLTITVTQLAPPQSPALWFDMADPASMARTGDLIDSITDRIAGVVATAAGAARPSFLPDLRASGGPRARTRFAGGQSLSIPATVSINRQACSIFVVTRTAVKPAVGSGDRAAFLIASETAVRTALYQWDGAELYTWDNTGTATPTGIIAAHGTSVQWLTAGAANVQVGSGPAVWSRGTPLAANTATGGRIGLWTGTSFPLTGDIMGVLIFNRQLNATERNEVLTWCRTRYGSPPVSVATLVGFSGDSITEGIQTANPQLNPHARDVSYPAQIEQLAGGSFRYMNCGIGSAALQQNCSGAQLALLTARMNGWPGVTRRVIFGLWGTNDLGGGRTGPQMRADLDTWIAGLRSGVSGAVVGHGTILPRSGLSGAQATARADFNDYVMARGAYAGGGAALDFRIDTAAISGLGNPADTAKFADGLHPTTSGYADLAAGIWNGGLSAQVV